MSGNEGEQFKETLARFRGSFSFEAWFDKFCKDLGLVNGENESVMTEDLADENEKWWPKSPLPFVLEALSDSSCEQTLNVLSARHLRRYGQDKAKGTGGTFWVRTEWDDVDISYGLARNWNQNKVGWSRNGGWDRAWEEGRTGDLGQCEVKLCYTHLYSDKMHDLSRQLKKRMKKDFCWYKKMKDKDGASEANVDRLTRQKYHGIVWLFQHEGEKELAAIGPKVEQQARDCELHIARPFQYSRNLWNLGHLWPNRNGQPYQCGLAVMLVELRSDEREECRDGSGAD